MRLAFILLFIAVGSTGITAQDMVPDTTLMLDDVTIYSSRIRKFAAGQRMETLDSATRVVFPSATLAELIPGFTSSYVRNYGQGSLATLSFRGTSANHTALLWNGIRLAPPNIGYLDISLVQGGFFPDISVLHGGASSMFGSGSVGASVLLENRPVFLKNSYDLDLGISAGSFGMLSAQGSGTVSTNKVFSRTVFSFTRSKNDFTYNDLNGKEEKMAHSEYLRSGFLQDLALRLPGNQYLMASAWFQYAERNIPATLTEDSATAEQMDRSWRTMLIWKDFNPKNTLEAKLAYFNEFTRYADPTPSIYSTIATQSMAGSFESSWDAWKNGAFFAGVQFFYDYADLDYYGRPQDQENLAVYVSFRHSFPSIGWQVSLNGRQEFFTGFNSPFLFSAGTEGKIWRAFSGNFSVSRNFRAPTLNERFWVPGGNPDLKPEESWNAEAGILYDKKFNFSTTKAGLTFFQSWVDNWILWLPVTSSLWAVENAQEVWSRGMEVFCNQAVEFGRVDLDISGSYTLSRSTNEEKLFDQDASYRKQLIYTPVHRFIIQSGAGYRG
ncbi:MAG: TonB-dependent receptor, partial [Bacteroidales bacterium]|nr:TonB-dependent receptor [Bacteroidales bacterium]